MTANLSSALLPLIEREVPLLRALPETRAGSEATWSPKEELGHLIDSAANNHIRFVRALIEPEFRGPLYAQNDWVRVHRYRDMPWLTIVEFWFHYNSFLAALLECVPEEKLLTTCYIGAGEGVSLRFVVEDYVLHMQHHLDHLLGRAHVTPYPS
jgi:hypothetical protein